MNNTFGVGDFGTGQSDQIYTGFRELVRSTPFDQGRFSVPMTQNKLARTILMPTETSKEVTVQGKKRVLAGMTPGEMRQEWRAWIDSYAVTQLRRFKGDMDKARAYAYQKALASGGDSIWETPPMPIYKWVADPGATNTYTETEYSYDRQSDYSMPQTWRLSGRRRPRDIGSYQDLFSNM